MSIAEQLRAETRDRIGRLTPAERIALALRLGDEDIQIYCAAQGRTPDEARAAFRRARSAGRSPSVANESRS